MLSSALSRHSVGLDVYQFPGGVFSPTNPGASERALQDTASGRFWHELRFDGTAIERVMWKVPLPFLKNEAPDLTFSVDCPPA